MFSQADLARSRGTAGAFHVRRGASRAQQAVGTGLSP